MHLLWQPIVMKDENSLIEGNHSSENPWISDSVIKQSILQLFLLLKVLCAYSECGIQTKQAIGYPYIHTLPSDGSAISSWEHAEWSPQICFSIFNHNTLIWSSSPLQFPNEYQKWFRMEGILGAISLFCWIFFLLLPEIDDKKYINHL